MGKAKTELKKDQAQKKEDQSMNYDVREVGRIQSIREFLVTAIGLPSCINGQVVEFHDGTLGLVMGFNGEKVQILVLSLKVNLRVR